jgi:hypothetical protein
MVSLACGWTGAEFVSHLSPTGDLLLNGGYKALKAQWSHNPPAVRRSL